MEAPVSGQTPAGFFSDATGMILRKYSVEILTKISQISQPTCNPHVKFSSKNFGIKSLVLN